LNVYRQSTFLFRNSSTKWPTPTQELLVKAAVLEGEGSYRAWAEWREKISGGQVDDKSRQLFPQVYWNIKRQNIEQTEIEPFIEEYRRVKLKNSLLFQAVRNPLQALVEAGIPVMLLKGAALSLKYYKDPGLRPMDDVDILVPPDQAGPALDIVKEYGWTSKRDFSGPHAGTFMFYSASKGVKNPADFAFDLNWHLINLNCAGDADREYWAEAEPAEFMGIPLLTLNPGHQLLHVCVHGMTHIPMSLKWIPDAARILECSKSEIDWDQLLPFIDAQDLILPVCDTLLYVNKLLGIFIPEDVLARLETYKGTDTEQREYYALTGRYNESGSLPLLWVIYNRHTRDQQERGGPTLSFIQYLQTRWGLAKKREVPGYFLRLVIKRLWKIITGILGDSRAEWR